MDNLVPQLYREYGIYVNTNRALPNLIDGLKPVERRVLMSCYEIARSKFIKSARIDGHCLVGETKIKLTNGKKTIEEIYKENLKDFFLYGFDTNLNKPVVTKADCVKLTKYVDTLIQITTESGIVRCTEDHLWLTKTGEYKKACLLKENDELEAVQFGITDKNSCFNNNWLGISGYEAVSNNEKSYLCHHLSDEYNCKNKIDVLYEMTSGFDRHHIDFNYLNNDPFNIIRLKDGDHARIHITDWIYNKGGIDFLHEHCKKIHEKNPQIVENLKEFTKNKIAEDPDWCSKNSKKFWDSLDENSKKEFCKKIGEGIKRFYLKHGTKKKSDATKEYWSKNSESVINHREKNRLAGIRTSKNNFIDNHKIKIIKIIKSVITNNYELNEENYELIRIKGKGYPTFDKILNYFNSYEEAIQEAKNYSNHTVLKIEIIKLEKEVPVYDIINSEIFHNFVVLFDDDSGLISHNCLGHYHPHSLCYSTIVQLVNQGFLEGQGNFGTNVGVDPCGAAASRYTECKLAKNTLDMAFTYIDYVKKVESELDDEPEFLPTMFPFCLIGNEYTIGIGFGYKTLIPTYKITDLYKRLYYLLGLTKEKPTITPISNCKILSSKTELESLLTTGKGKISIKGIYTTDPAHCKVTLKSWPPGRGFETLLNKFSKELESQDIGFTDLSTTETCIVFEVLKQRNRDELFKKFVAKLDAAIVGSISFENVVVTSSGEVKTTPIDEMLYRTFENYRDINNQMLTVELIKRDKIIFKYQLLKKIRPFIGSYINLNIQEAIEKISEAAKVDSILVKSLLNEYKISKLLTLNTDITDLEKERKDLEDKQKNLHKFVLDQYNSFIE